MSVDYMLRMSGADFGLAKVVAVGDFVQHYGTKQTGFVTKVMPQLDSTAELLVTPYPVRYESLGGHRKYGGGHYSQDIPCSYCTDTRLCPDGARSKEHDEKERQWATYHVNVCVKPADLLADAETHHCGRCDHPEHYTDRKPCNRKNELRDLHTRALAVIAKSVAEVEKTQ